MNTPKTLGVIFILGLIGFVSFSFFQKDTYIGFFYPDATNLQIDIQSEESFGTLDECRTWAKVQALNHAKIGDTRETWDYECGKNCNLSEGKPYVCEETLE